MANAPYGNRIAAMILDSMAVIPYVVPGAVLFAASMITGHDGYCTDATGMTNACRQPNGLVLGVAFLVYFGGFVAYYINYCRKLGRTGQTWGRKTMGYKVVDATTEMPIGAWKAFARMMVGGIDSLPCYLGYLWPLWDAKGQRLSDKIMNTRAVKA
jgi:uncharacterized RDD family membrane protein YckC